MKRLAPIDGPQLVRILVQEADRRRVTVNAVLKATGLTYSHFSRWRSGLVHPSLAVYDRVRVMVGAPLAA